VNCFAAYEYRAACQEDRKKGRAAHPYRRAALSFDFFDYESSSPYLLHVSSFKMGFQEVKLLFCLYY
jgi:hypothetical protein